MDQTRSATGSSEPSKVYPFSVGVLLGQSARNPIDPVEIQQISQLAIDSQAIRELAEIVRETIRVSQVQFTRS